MFRDPQFDLAARELEYELSLVATRTDQRVYRRPHREFEWEFEAFDPTPPAAGTIIISVQQQPVNNAADLQARVDKLKKEGKKAAVFLVSNGSGDTTFVAINLQ